ncbi:MAG: hypothetical protein FWH26_00845 [Oscillospiraceae bacterium]|nr:hypothetical protein [Oscillospiraceae bacterium]
MSTTTSPEDHIPSITFPSEELRKEWELPSFSAYSQEIALLDDNPIDFAYWERREEWKKHVSLQLEYDLYIDFADIWKTEMENALDFLRDYLPEERLDELNQSQKGWEAYTANDALLGTRLREKIA